MCVLAEASGNAAGHFVASPGVSPVLTRVLTRTGVAKDAARKRSLSEQNEFLSY